MGKAYRLPVRVVPVTLELSCAVTPAEAQRAREDVFELQGRRDEKRRAIKALQAELAGIESAIVRKMRAASELWEQREVLCEERHIWATGEVEVVRLDTRELVRRRAMTPEERATLEREHEKS